MFGVKKRRCPLKTPKLCTLNPARNPKTLKRLRFQSKLYQAISRKTSSASLSNHKAMFFTPCSSFISFRFSLGFLHVSSVFAFPKPRDTKRPTTKDLCHPKPKEKSPKNPPTILANDFGNLWPFLAVLGHFWQFWAIVGHFWPFCWSLKVF